LYIKYLLAIPPKMVHDSSGGRDPRLKTTAIDNRVFNATSFSYIDLLHSDL